MLEPVDTNIDEKSQFDFDDVSHMDSDDPDYLPKQKQKKFAPKKQEAPVLVGAPETSAKDRLIELQ